MANTIAAMASLNQGESWPARPERRGDCTAQNISSLGHARHGHVQFHCNYYLGERLFRDLQGRMKHSEFIASIQRLLRYSLEKPQPESLEGYRAGIEEVRRAFPEWREIIEVHYSGDLNAPYRWDPDDAIDSLHHDAVIWMQKPIYEGGFVSFSGRLTGNASLVSRSVSEAQRGGLAAFSISEGREVIGSILPKLPAGRSWTLDDPGDTVADVFELDGNSFSVRFRWPAAAGGPAGKRIIVWGYADASRRPAWGDGADSLGTSMIR